jgi:uncharacterized protein YkvS
MCCLKNEQETYEWLNSKCPNVGDVVHTSDGLKGEVSSVNVLRQMVKVVISTGKDEREVKEYPVEELKFVRGRKYRDEKPEDSEIQELEALEKKDRQSKDGKESKDASQRSNSRGSKENRQGKGFSKRGEGKPLRERQDHGPEQHKENIPAPKEQRDRQQNRDYKPRDNQKGGQRPPRRGQDRRGNKPGSGPQGRGADNKKDQE